MGEEGRVSARKRRVPRISRFLLVHGTDCVPSSFRVQSPGLFRSPSVAVRPLHSIFEDASRCLAALPAASSSLFPRTGEGGRTALGWECGEKGVFLFGAAVPRPDTFYRAVNAGCGELVRSTELFRARRQIYRATRAWPVRLGSSAVAGLFRGFSDSSTALLRLFYSAPWHDRLSSCSSIPTAFTVADYSLPVPRLIYAASRRRARPEALLLFEPARNYRIFLGIFP